MKWIVTLRSAGIGAVLFAGGPSMLAAQSGLASQTLGRGYTHLFIAYAVLWVLVLAWVFTIARRVSRIEKNDS